MSINNEKKVKEYISKLEKENTELKDEIKHWQISWDILIKENAELKERFKADECDLCNDLQDENEELKQQLADIKYLDRDEVEKIIETTLMAYQCGVEEINEIAFEDAEADKDGKKSITTDAEFHKQIEENKKSAIDYAVTSICNLAIPIIKDKIIEALSNFANKLNLELLVIEK